MGKQHGEWYVNIMSRMYQNVWLFCSLLLRHEMAWHQQKQLKELKSNFLPSYANSVIIVLFQFGFSIIGVGVFWSFPPAP
jgi:hypothetical protein